MCACLWRSAGRDALLMQPLQCTTRALELFLASMTTELPDMQDGKPAAKQAGTLGMHDLRASRHERICHRCNSQTPASELANFCLTPAGVCKQVQRLHGHLLRVGADAFAALSNDAVQVDALPLLLGPCLVLGQRQIFPGTLQGCRRTVCTTCLPPRLCAHPP